MRSIRSFALFALLITGAAAVVASGGAAPAAARPAGAATDLRSEAGERPPLRASNSEAGVPNADIRLADDWIWPVEPPVTVVAPFRAPPTPYAAGHRGIDLAAVPGTGVRSPAPGIVSFAGSVAGRPVVSIDHGEGLVTAVEPVDALVAESTPVDAGQQIGTMAEGGHCGARCVHFGVRLHGEYVSPLLLLGGLPRAVLLPQH